MMILLILLGVGALILFWVVGLYNRFVKKRAMMEEGWSGIDVQLKKRYDLIPNLVETVKGYAAHEKETLDAVVNARNKALQADGIEAQTKAENQLNTALANVFALSEAYPDLKANTNFLELQRELSVVENDIEKARRYYNATVRENNIMVESFPSNLIANAMNFELGVYFEIEDPTQRATPQVKF
jgi:LemA protein